MKLDYLRSVYVVPASFDSEKIYQFSFSYKFLPMWLFEYIYWIKVDLKDFIKKFL